MFSPRYVSALVYMLQSTEYQTSPYLKWFWRVKNFKIIMNRRQLDRTRAAKLLSLSLILGMTVQVLAGAYLIVNAQYLVGFVMLVTYPLVWAHLAVIPIIVGRVLIVGPKEKRLIKESQAIFEGHMATKIAVAGSYGKTSMKEMLATVLSEGKKVAITPANKNVATSHAIFAKNLTGEEEVLIIEYGEGRPGDVAQFSATTIPNIGIITGIAPAHLDQYSDLDSAARDIFALADYLKDQQVYVNGDSTAAQAYVKQSHKKYSSHGIGDWKVSDIKVKYDGLEFKLKKAKQVLHLKSQLLGRHQIGPISLAAVLGLELGLTEKQIEIGVAKTAPYEHRMQSRHLNGAWIIDDTYNGNIDGIAAGLQLMKDLPAQRKIYVTPGLVDQGNETETVHIKIGELIASANPASVVLMQNSVTGLIQEGLSNGKYTGEVEVHSDPLGFYSNLNHFVAAGDLVVMQNDWTDNYS